MNGVRDNGEKTATEVNTASHNRMGRDRMELAARLFELSSSPDSNPLELIKWVRDVIDSSIYLYAADRRNLSRALDSALDKLNRA